MDERLTHIIEKIHKVAEEAREGAIPVPPLAEAYDDIDYLIDLVHQKNQRISKLEKIIIEDRISKL